ncbi:MAG: CBS domain-containing protein [Proteobacteria bacterium]|nr:CBS domain-containing protein [Pseudomonadota bacterium]
MKLRDLMKDNPKTVTVDCTLKEAAMLMDQVDTGVLPVVEGNKQNPSQNPIGVLTDRDMVVRCISQGRDPNTTTVEEAFTPGTVYCMEDETDKDAILKMRQEKVGRILVKGNGNTILGVVSMAGILRRLPESAWDFLEAAASNTNREASEKKAV